MAVVVTMAGHAEQNVHPFFRPRQNFAVDAALDSDVEERQHKRQRTRSPEPKPTVLSTWEDQSKAAAQEVPVSTVSAESRSSTDYTTEGLGQQHPKASFAQRESAVGLLEPASETSHLSDNLDPQDSITEPPPKRILQIRSDGKLVSPKALAEKLEAPAGEWRPNSAPLPQLQAMPPENILKVYSDGKLSSLKAKTPTEHQKRKGRKGTSRQQPIIKLTRIAIMKYGTGASVRASLGCQIDEILCGTGIKPGTNSSKPRDPPRSTHPFFTGELGRKENRDTEMAIAISSCEPASQISQAVQPIAIFRPRESRITSKPPAAINLTNAAQDAAFPTFGTDNAKVARFPGARDPIWPPAELLHVGRTFNCLAGFSNKSIDAREPMVGRKLKNLPIQIIPEESILFNTTDLIHHCKNNGHEARRTDSRDARLFRRPHRKLMTGEELQQTVSLRVASNLPKVTSSEIQEENGLSSSQFCNAAIHQGLSHVYSNIGRSRAAFDKFECETQEWVHKYSPKNAEHVLQQGREALILRDWLKGLTVSTVGSGIDRLRSKDLTSPGRRSGLKAGRTKKRRPEELNGFVISSDEEADSMDEISDPDNPGLSNSYEKKSVINSSSARDGEKTSNAIIISGPHGCGKTAAVLAAATELGFEIFEVNAGSRRSGKDILDKVGDMTRNHLVKHRQDEDLGRAIEQSSETRQVNDKLQADIDNRRQGTMQSFLQPRLASKTKKQKAKHLESKNQSLQTRRVQDVPSKPRDQKQSLVLLEEVDVLFEDDKLFWATVIDLIFRSKRPVIMTCSDETLLPLDDMALHAILRFTSPPEALAIDYLLLVAASEGHLLSRRSVQLLYNAKSLDFRASLAELNFYCQMGIGDSKGGLEWMLIDEPSSTRLPGKSGPLRVVSENTYCSGMGWLSGEDLSSKTYRTISEVTELGVEVWNGWCIDIGAADAFSLSARPPTDRNTQEEALYLLQQFDRACEAFSAADILPAAVVRHEHSTTLDIAQPELTDRVRCNHIEGPGLLQADPLIDHTGTSDRLALSLRASMGMARIEFDGSPINIGKVIDSIPKILHHQRPPSQMTRSNFSSAFLPISSHSPVVLGMPKGPSISSLESPISVITQDVAPYIRGIVAYDLRLEEQRRQLRSLLDQGGANTKKTRTTRASRAALEGGSKANTRRERWFPKNTDCDSVLRTGCETWENIASQTILCHSEGQSVGGSNSRRSSFTDGIGTHV